MVFFYQLGVLILCIAALPVMGIIALVILLFSGRPVLFTQKRTGFDGRVFVLYKFRTMVNGAEGLKRKYRHLNSASGPAFKIHNDPRFTPIGRFLSHTGLDELPQLWNVLKGEMALIGPRPLPVAEAAKLKSWMRKRETVLPGIISPWILDGYHRRTFDEWMKSDIAYTHQKSFMTDLKLAWRTIGFMFRLIVRELL